MKNSTHAKSHVVVKFQQKVFRQKGRFYPDYCDAAGKMKPWPGGEWQDGKEGRWADRGVVHEHVEKFRAWKWLLQRLRMELHEIKLFLIAFLRRK